MQTFMKFLEAKANRYFVRFVNTTDRSDIEIDVIFPVMSYIGDYLKEVGLWAGDSSKYPASYKKECKIISPTSKVMDIPEEKKMNPKLTGNGLLKKLQDTAIYLSETADDLLLYSVGEAERLFKLYFKKLTGLEDDSYWTYWKDLNSGIQCVLKDEFSSIQHEMKALGLPDLLKKGQIERVISIRFAHDSSLDETKSFGSEFDPVYDGMPKTYQRLAFHTYEKNDLIKLKSFIDDKMTETGLSPALRNTLFEFKEMIETAIRKNVTLLVSKI